MSIYIKGMEMPRSCFYCPFQHKTTTECLITHKYYNWGLTTPPSDCPIIHVPPHGRLGDLDALKAKAIERSEKCGDLVNVLDKVITAYDIETAPTVIPAKKDGK